ncbi:MAG: hypothetical protein AB8G22_29700, partial [Saprospiraceae bacterium]
MLKQSVNRPPSAVHRFLTFTFYILSFIFYNICFSCGEPKVGCLDIAATNFGADSDDPCEDCCTFPNLKIQFIHRISQGDTLIPIQYDSFYQV